MENKEIEELGKNIDMKLATEISKSYVHEMSKLETAKSQINVFKIICIIFAIVMLICVTFTSTVSLQLMRLIDNIVIVDESTEDVDMSAETGDGSGSAINLYGDDNSISNNDK